jgi:hypothetical protein
LAIKLGTAENTLRVVADGPDLSFYINDTLVKQASYAGLANGTVGIKFLRKSGYTGTGLYVNYATLNPVTPETQAEVEADSVSEEQQQLNETAPPSERDEELTD